MPFLNLKNFKGLAQHIDYSELPMEYANDLKNIDTFNPLGQMRVRGGYAKKYSTQFTDTANGYEYYFKNADDTKFFLNDNGSIKISTDGAAFGAAETLPTGATIESGFKCNFFGYKNHVLMTTGVGATNYILGYYYVNRVAASNTGLFHNQEENTGYVWSKSQLIMPNGFLSMVYNVVYVGSYYFMSFSSSSVIEKRDSNFKLIDRFKPYSSIDDNVVVSLDGNSTRNELYVGTPDGLYAFDADTLLLENSQTGATFQDMLGLCNDGTNLYGITATGIEEVLLSDFSDTGIGIAGLTSGTDIACDATADTGYIFTIENDIITRRQKTDLSSTHTNNNYAGLLQIEHDGSTHAIVTSSGNYIYKVKEADVTLETNGDYQEAKTSTAIIWVAGTDLRVISAALGWIQVYDTGDISYPGLLTMVVYRSASTVAPSLDAGTYFYKISIVDMDGQEYCLSDPAIVPNQNGSRYSTIYIGANLDYINDLYRVSHINIYRAYNSTVDSISPETDYKFLQKIDINKVEWNDVGNFIIKWFDQDQLTPTGTSETFYFTYLDDHVDETTISDVTFLENSGIGDLVKPRYINGKYMTWIDNKLHLANFYHDGDTYPNRVLRSSKNAPDAIAFYDYYDFDVSEGDAIKGITGFLGRSVVFKSRKMGSFYDGILEFSQNIGISSEDGYLVKDNIVFFANETGIFTFNGNNISKISDPIQTYYALGTEWDHIAMFYYDVEDVLLFSLRTDSAVTRRTFVYHPKSGMWNYYTGFAFLKIFKNNANEYIGLRGDYVCDLFSTYTKDLEDVGGGNGTAITVYYESPMIRFSELEGENAELLYYFIKFVLNNAVPIYLYKYISTGTSLIDTYTPAASTITGMETRRHNLNNCWGEAFKFLINGSVPNDVATESSLFKLAGISIKYEPAGMI